MDNIECPYCEHEYELDQSEGHGLDEGPDHEEHCPICRKEFFFTTYVSYSYTPYCKKGDCDFGEWYVLKHSESKYETRDCKREICQGYDIRDRKVLGA